MKVGDIVSPTIESRFKLVSGCSYYTEAVVISEEPLILVSLESDMMWSATIKKEYFEVVGKASKKILKKCNRRLIE